MRRKTYSNDLRERVIEHVKAGHTHRETAALFKIAKSSVTNWWGRYQQEGSMKSKARGGSKGRINLSQLKEYVEENPNRTLKEIGQVFGVSDCAIHKRLKQLGFVYKKKNLNIWKLVSNKEKRI